MDLPIAVEQCWKCNAYGAPSSGCRIPSGHWICGFCEAKYVSDRDGYHCSIREVTARIEFEITWGFLSVESLLNDDWLLRDLRDVAHDWFLCEFLVPRYLSSYDCQHVHDTLYGRVNIHNAYQKRLHAIADAERMSRNEENLARVVTEFARPIAIDLAREDVDRLYSRTREEIVTASRIHVTELVKVLKVRVPDSFRRGTNCRKRVENEFDKELYDNYIIFFDKLHDGYIFPDSRTAMLRVVGDGLRKQVSAFIAMASVIADGTDASKKWKRQLDRGVQTLHDSILLLQSDVRDCQDQEGAVVLGLYDMVWELLTAMTAFIEKLQ